MPIKLEHAIEPNFKDVIMWKHWHLGNYEQSHHYIFEEVV